MKTVRDCLVLLALVLLVGCAGFNHANPRAHIDRFAEELSQALDSVPENWTSAYFSHNEAIQQVKLKVSQNSDLVLNLLTNETKTWYPAKAQFALILAGETASGVVKPLADMLRVSENAATVAGILPFCGANGMLALSAGLQSKDANVRRVCASSLTWPIELPDVDREFQIRYRKVIRPYLDSWVQALRDPDVRVARAAAKSIGYATSDDSIVEMLEKLSKDDGIDASVRSAARKSVNLMRSNEGTNRAIQD